MMSRHFALSLELSRAIAKRLPHAKNQLSGPGNFFNQFVTDMYYIYKYININRVLIVRMNNDDVTIESSFFQAYLRYINIHILLKFQPSITSNG